MTTNPNLSEILASTRRVTCEICEGEEEPDRLECEFNPQDEERLIITSTATTGPSLDIVLSRKDLEAPQWGNSRTYYHLPYLTFTFWG